MRDNATAWNLLLEQRRTISLWKWLIRENPSFHRSQQNTHGGKKSSIFWFSHLRWRKTKRKPTWKSQVSKNKKKPTVANSAIFYPKSSITPENQVTMYWVKSDNRTALAVIGLPTLLKQPTKLKKDFLNGISIKLRTNTQIRDIFLGSEMPPLSHLWQEIVPAENFAFEKRLM